jgi:hypothetical protein
MGGEGVAWLLGQLPSSHILDPTTPLALPYTSHSLTPRAGSVLASSPSHPLPVTDDSTDSSFYILVIISSIELY